MGSCITSSSSFSFTYSFFHREARVIFRLKTLECRQIGFIGLDQEKTRKNLIGISLLVNFPFPTSIVEILELSTSSTDKIAVASFYFLSVIFVGVFKLGDI